MKLVLDTFARNGIEACLGGDVEAAVEVALSSYTRTRGLPPSFLPALSDELEAAGGGLELTLEPAIEQVLEREVRGAQRVSAGQLGTYAVLAYLADLDRSAAEVLPAPARS